MAQRPDPGLQGSLDRPNKKRRRNKPAALLVRAGRGDARVVNALMRAFYREAHLVYGRANAAAAKDLMRGTLNGGIYLIRPDVTSRGAVGYFVLTFSYSLERGGKMAILDELFVVPGSRGEGLGTAAVREAVRIARKERCKAIGLEVDEQNERAAKLYQSLGFAGLGRWFFVLRS